MIHTALADRTYIKRKAAAAAEKKRRPGKKPTHKEILFAKDSQFSDSEALPKLIGTKRQAIEDDKSPAAVKRNVDPHRPNMAALDAGIEGFFDTSSSGHRYYGGEMYNVRRMCYLLVEAPDSYAVFKPKFGNSQRTMFIDHPQLLPALELIMDHAVKEMFPGTTKKEAQPYFALSDDIKVFDKDSRLIKDYDWNTTSCHMNILLRLFGFYAYEQATCSGVKKMKAIVKVIQAKMMTEENTRDKDVCLL